MRECSPQAHSCLQPLNHSLEHHSQVGQRKHHQQLAGVLGQAPVTRFALSELTINHPKRMLHLGADARLEQQIAIDQPGIDRRQYLHAQVVLLKHVPKAQDGAFIRQAGDACIELGKFANDEMLSNPKRKLRNFGSLPKSVH
jgi:hypothetical protein